MAYAAPHGRLTIFGDAYSGAEIWQTGLRLVGTVIPDTAAFQAVDAAVAAFLAKTSTQFTQGFRYLGLKWAPQDINGKYGPDGEAVEWLRPSPLTGGSIETGYPQIAVVLSLRTARARGYASNGRMYIPSAAGINGSDGKLPQGTAATMATDAATMLSGIGNSGIGIPAVMSAVGAGRTEVVTSVRVGRVMDTQRRRRSALQEEYSPESPLPS